MQTFIAMKRFSLISIGIFISTIILSQAPDSFSYQAILRNTDGTIRANESVSVQIEIKQGSIDGSTAYLEIHNTVTSSTGLITLQIGSGTTSDDLSLIDWSNGPYFLDVTVNGTNLGASQLLSVPYALHSKTAETITGEINITESDPVFSAWDKTSGIEITESQISDFQTYLISETDPVYNASIASDITGTDTANWNNKLDSYTEIQTLADVAALDNSVNTQLKNITDPTDAQDAATKAYVDELKSEINEIRISLGTSIKDIDGNYYKIITIGTQVWMAENLKTTKYNDGTSIPLVTDVTEWSGLSGPGYCWYNNDDKTYKDTYGALYNWYTVNTDNLCPSGWHVSTDEEWTVLIDYLGGKNEVGGKLKETGTTHWDSPNTGATNETGFTGLPGGFRLSSGDFNNIGDSGFWWSATEIGNTTAWRRKLSRSSTSVYRDGSNKEFGFSVRCLRD